MFNRTTINLLFSICFGLLLLAADFAIYLLSVVLCILQNPDAWVSAMKGPMRNVVEKVSGSVTAATMRQDKINLAQVKTMEAKTTEQDSAPPENQENQPQTKKRDCKLLVCSIFMIMIVTFHVDSCLTIIYISLSLFYHFFLFYIPLS